MFCLLGDDQSRLVPGKVTAVPCGYEVVGGVYLNVPNKYRNLQKLRLTYEQNETNIYSIHLLFPSQFGEPTDQIHFNVCWTHDTMLNT